MLRKSFARRFRTRRIVVIVDILVSRRRTAREGLLALRTLARTKVKHDSWLRATEQCVIVSIERRLRSDWTLGLDCVRAKAKRWVVAHVLTQTRQARTRRILVRIRESSGESESHSHIELYVHSTDTFTTQAKMYIYYSTRTKLNEMSHQHEYFPKRTLRSILCVRCYSYHLYRYARWGKVRKRNFNFSPMGYANNQLCYLPSWYTVLGIIVWAEI